jgi:hypothetical protein
MSQTRFRQIARLENAARRYIGMTNRIQDQWENTRVGAAGHAAILAFLIRYGDPRAGEPLSCAWQRFKDTDVWKQYCDKWNELKFDRLGDEWKEYGESTPKDNRLAFISRTDRILPFSRDGVFILSMELRHELLERFSGNNEKEKLDNVFASAPPWLVWFTFGDYTAKLLGLPMPDLATVMHFARSKEDFANWYGLPRGAFESRPWPNGPDNEQLSCTNLDLLRPAKENPNHQMTRRESRRAKAAVKGLAESTDEWPSLLSVNSLTMPFREQMKLLQDQRAAYPEDFSRFDRYRSCFTGLPHQVRFS